MSGVGSGGAMEGADLEAASWSEKVEDLVESGAVDAAISLLETLALKFQAPSSTVDELQFTSVLFELAKLYDTKGFSLKADEARSRAITVKNRSVQSAHQSCEDQVAREEPGRVRDSGESCLPQSSGSTVEVSVDDGNLDSGTKSTNVNGQPGEASSDDDWEAKADCEPDELLPSQQIPEVSKLSLKDSMKEVPKRRGRGAFLYEKEGLVADQLLKESSVCNSEHEVPKIAEEGSTRKSAVYGTRHVLVLDGFNPSYNTIDLENIFKSFKDQGFVIRWVNDTVALAVFRSPSAALEARNSINCPFSVRVLEEDDILMSSLPTRELEPPRQRPQTSVRTAQRLIARGMGIKMPLQFGAEQLRREEEARKDRIVTRQHLKHDAWGAED